MKEKVLLKEVDMNKCCEKWKSTCVESVYRFCPECGSELNQSKWCECKNPTFCYTNDQKEYWCNECKKPVLRLKIEKIQNRNYACLQDFYESVNVKLNEIIDIINCKVL